MASGFSDPYSNIEDYDDYWIRQKGAGMKVGVIVRVRQDAFPGDEMAHVMYAGWYGVITRVQTTGEYIDRVFVDSDEFTRRTGQLQAVSFRQWFSTDELDLITD